MLLAALSACTPARAIAPLDVTQVISAHHGVCPKRSRAIYGERAAHLFAQTWPRIVSMCMSHTQSQILANAACSRYSRNTVFLTLARPVHAQFGERGNFETLSFRTFGAQYIGAYYRREPGTALFLPVAAEKAANKITDPPGTPRMHLDLWKMYGAYFIPGDPLGLSQGECPA